jgi:hypothetical protein
MRDAQDDIARAIDAQPAVLSLGDALVAGFAAVAEGAYLERTRRLLPVVFGSPSYGAVWSQELRQHRPPLRQAIARRLGCGPDDLTTDVTASVFLTLVEDALAAMVETGSAPAPLLAERLRLVGSPLFASTGTVYLATP